MLIDISLGPRQEENVTHSKEHLKPCIGGHGAEYLPCIQEAWMIQMVPQIFLGAILKHWARSRSHIWAPSIVSPPPHTPQIKEFKFKSIFQSWAQKMPSQYSPHFYLILLVPVSASDTLKVWSFIHPCLSLFQPAIACGMSQNWFSFNPENAWHEWGSNRFHFCIILSS